PEFMTTPVTTKHVNYGPAKAGHANRSGAKSSPVPLRPAGYGGQPSRASRRRMERATRFERATLTLARLCSTPELRPRSGVVIAQWDGCFKPNPYSPWAGLTIQCGRVHGRARPGHPRRQ